MAGDTKVKEVKPKELKNYEKNPNYEKGTWEEFRDSSLLWWINQTLHLFGWAIVLEKTSNGFMYAVPCKTKFRGFSSERNTQGYKDLTKHLSENMDRLVKDSSEE